MISSFKLAGVDPGILRELSGIYAPFVKAFKELISNAYDADADDVKVQFSEHRNELKIADDGIGMTPFEFRNEFTKLGGSSKKNFHGFTKKGRRKIGSKGIGFLAVARYCGLIEIVSSTKRKHHAKIHCTSGARGIDLAAHFEVPIPRNLLAGRIKISSITVKTTRTRRKLRTSDFEFTADGRVKITKNRRPRMSDEIEIRCSLDCRDLEFKATIDYDYLLSLENKKDLAHLSDFCRIEVCALNEDDERVGRQYTNLTLQRLKAFVIRDLQALKRPGRVRNIESESGLDAFIWHLSRCTPIKYDLPKAIQETFGSKNLEVREIRVIDRLVIALDGQDDFELKRPVWGGNQGQEWSASDDVSAVVRINESGLRAQGYIWGHRAAIFPAEYRGIAIRVRNVQIGAPTFFGLEQTLTGAARGLLSQITGEVNVLEGLDATDALNPGRDSFYEENSHYKVLHRSLVGSGETITGILGDLIQRMLERLQVLSAVESNLSRASNYRSTLLNLSLAINHYGSSSNDLIDLKRLFSDSIRANGLSEREDYDMLPGPRVAGFYVKAESDLAEERVVDYDGRTVYFNFKHDRWNNKIFVLGHHYEVIRKIGANSDPLCEIDTAEKKIYVNWGHSLRQQMGDLAFLKSAIAWKLSYHASQGNIETMMDLALNLLSFNGA